ncbi:hypothetical protein D3C86_1337710 [compost metagenome]
MTAAGADLPVDRQVLQGGDHDRLVQEERGIFDRQTTETSLGDDLGRRQFVLVVRGAFDVGQELGVQQAAIDQDNQIGALAVPWVQQLDGVIDQTIKCLVVAAGADRDLARDRAFAHHAFRRIGAVLLNPADVDILQQRVGRAVGVGSRTGAVETNHDAIERLAFNDGARQACLEVLKLGPGIEQGVRDGGVEVGLFAAVSVLVQGTHITRRTSFLVGVSTAGDGAANTKDDSFAVFFIHADDVDFFQEVAGLLNGGFEFLLHRRGDREGLRRGADAVEFGDLLQKAAVGLTSFITHRVLRKKAGVRTGSALGFRHR